MYTSTQYIFYNLIYGSHTRIFIGNIINIWESKNKIFKYINIIINLLHVILLFICNTNNIILLLTLFNSLILSSLIKLYFFHNDFERIDKLCKESFLNVIIFFFPKLFKSISYFIEPIGFILNCILFILFYFINFGGKYFTIFLLFLTAHFIIHKPYLSFLKVEWTKFDIFIRIIIFILFIIFYIGTFFNYFIIELLIRFIISFLSINILLLMIDISGIINFNSYKLLSNNNQMYNHIENIESGIIILFMILLYIKQNKIEKKLYFIQISILLIILYTFGFSLFY